MLDSKLTSCGYRSALTGCFAALLLAAFACSSADKGVDGSSVGGNGGYVPPGNGGTGNGGAGSIVWPPNGYTNVTDVSVGAYALGPDISSGAVPPNSGSGCSGLYAAVRDLKMGTITGGHPDFETAPSTATPITGIVESTLGADGKPVYANPSDAIVTAAGLHGQTYFDQWYHDTSGVNMTYLLALKLGTLNNIPTFAASRSNGGGLTDSSFFPLDGAGFGDQGQSHNFSFTTEIHTAFTYNGGETFTFKGDDDVWVFIDKKLVIDLGGRHAQLQGSVQLDTRGLTKGQVYDLAVFHAERHTSESNFQIQTTLAFTNCGTVNGVPVN